MGKQLYCSPIIFHTRARVFKLNSEAGEHMNFYQAISQGNKLKDDYSLCLRDIRNKLNSYKANLNNSWQAEEMVLINRAIDGINNDISSLSTTLDSLGQDIITTANDIKREEEARAAAAAAARAAATAKA